MQKQHKALAKSFDSCKEIHALANRLGGLCVTEIVGDRGIEASFKFAIPTMGEQFIRAVHWYSEVEVSS